MKSWFILGIMTNTGFGYPKTGLIMPSRRLGIIGEIQTCIIKSKTSKYFH